MNCKLCGQPWHPCELCHEARIRRGAPASSVAMAARATLAAMAAKKKPVDRGGSFASPTEAYYQQNDQHQFKVRLSMSTLSKLDDLVEHAPEKTKVGAVTLAIDLAHRELVRRK